MISREILPIFNVEECLQNIFSFCVKIRFFQTHLAWDTLHRLTTWCTGCTKSLHDTFSSHTMVLLLWIQHRKLMAVCLIIPISWQPAVCQTGDFSQACAPLHRIVMQCITVMPEAYFSRCRKIRTRSEITLLYLLGSARPGGL